MLLAPFKEAFKDNLATEADVDAALRGKFRTVIRLGLLDPPEIVPYTTIKDGPEPWNGEEHRAVAKAIARESIVMLKNSNGFLPLKKDKLRSIAVIGPRANEVQYDYYSGPAPGVENPAPRQGRPRSTQDIRARPPARRKASQGAGAPLNPRAPAELVELEALSRARGFDKSGARRGIQELSDRSTSLSCPATAEHSLQKPQTTTCWQEQAREPRQILQSLPGLEYRELPESDWCCGGAGSYSLFHYDLSQKILDRKIDNVAKTGAAIIATSCPACLIHLSFGARRRGLPIRVRHISEIASGAR